VRDLAGGVAPFSVIALVGGTSILQRVIASRSRFCDSIRVSAALVQRRALI
jgi:hypothetical protein